MHGPAVVPEYEIFREPVVRVYELRVEQKASILSAHRMLLRVQEEGLQG